MNLKQHKKRHISLHSNLDELLADFIIHANGRISYPIIDLVTWSHKQTVEVDHYKDEEVEQWQQ